MTTTSTPLTGWAQTWHDEQSIDTRRRAIRTFGRAMREPARWKQAWSDAGGTAGLLRLLSQASVREVRLFCTFVKNSNKRGKKSAVRERAIQELIMALLPLPYPSTELRTQDRRPLQKFYGRMLRGCSSDFVERILDGEDKSNPLYQQLDVGDLIVAHDAMLKRRLTDYLMTGLPQLSEIESKTTFSAFCHRELPVPGDRPNISSSMQFALEMLQARADLKIPAERWPRGVLELDVLVSVYRRFVKKSRSAERFFLFQLGLRLIKADPQLIQTQTATANFFWSDFIAFWRKHPRQYATLFTQFIRLEVGMRTCYALSSPLPTIVSYWKDEPGEYENLLALALRHGYSGSKQRSLVENYLTTCNAAFAKEKEPCPELRWRLLRLYCLHVPEKGVDIATSSDLGSLAKIEWDLEVFERLSRERALSLLERLYTVNPSYEFLRQPQSSVYAPRRLGTRRNFNAELLLITYRQGDSEHQRKALEEVDKFRKAAATSRDQEDRSSFAKAAASCAIASGDLDAYAETILWQQRFVRDPLTVKQIFAADAILTTEGVALLSGILLPQPMGAETLSTIKNRLAKANKIMKILDESVKTAKKEPSNKSSNWSAFRMLFRSVFQERVRRAKELELPADQSQLELFHIIWADTADLTRSIGSDVLRQSLASLVELHGSLSGASLISATKTLLEAAAEWNQKADRNQDHDEIAGLMEVLSNRALSTVADTNTPTLAADMIVQSIIANPSASSWHRRFLSLGFIRNLPAKEAEALLMSLATAIAEKLEDQSYVRVGDSEPPKSAPPTSLVKVTTVKYLAQLLGDADFIAPDSAVEVLVELFKAGTHIDIRLATLDSLLGALNTISGETGDQSGPNPTVERIVSTLELVIPLVGSVNERRPPSEVDWTEALKTQSIPAAGARGPGVPPLFSAILEIVNLDKPAGRFPNLLYLQREFLDRLVLPSLRRSQEEHRMWFSLFLAKHQPGIKAESLPHVPITPFVWRHMLRNYGHLLPSSVIKEYNEFVLFRMKPPAEIKRLNRQLLQDATLRNNDAVKHWFSIFGPHFSWGGELSNLMRLVTSPMTSRPTEAVNAIMSQASLILDEYTDFNWQWKELVASLRPVSSWVGTEATIAKKREGWEFQRRISQSLARDLIKLLESKLTSRKSDNARLPSTFGLRVLLLPFPILESKDQDDEEYHQFSAELDTCISSYLASPEGDVILWPSLAEEIHSTLAVYDKNARLRHAIYIGDAATSVKKDERDDPQLAATTQLVGVSVVLKLVESVGGSIASRKKTTAAEAKKSETSETEVLVRRLVRVMRHWERSGDAVLHRGVEEMFERWKDGHASMWNAICSWDESESKSPEAVGDV